MRVVSESEVKCGSCDGLVMCVAVSCDGLVMLL